MKPTKDIGDRFFAKLRRDPLTGCWLWTGARTAFGHGVIGRGRRGDGLVRAHRLAWELVFGPVPEGKLVCHRCDNPPCCNPGHLFVGTAADNSRDMVNKGRFSTPNARLAPTEVVAVREARRGGEAVSAIAARFGIRPRQVRRIVSGERWRHV